MQDEPPRARAMMIPSQFPADLTVATIEPEQLPADGRDPAALESLRSLGTHWATALTSAVLATPSAMVPAETNCLLNPRHPDFARIETDEPELLVTDLRLRKIKVPEPVSGD
jgi:RES domain-containing protein